MKKHIILTATLSSVMLQTAYAADATTSASKSTSTPTTSSKSTTTTSSKSTSSNKTTSTKTTTTTKKTTSTAVVAKNGDTAYTVVYGDTLKDIAKKYNTTVEVLADYNNLSNPNKIFAGQTILIPAKTTTNVTNTTDVVYTVVAGDTLDEIAKAHGTTYQELAKYNNISNPNKISIGQKITIPGTTVVTPVTPVAPVTPVTPVAPEKPITDPVPPVTTVTPEVDVVGTENTTYVGINGDYTTTDKTDNWDYYVVVDVKDGKIVDVDWDGKNETATTMTKDEYSEAGLYGMEKVSALGKTWHEQAEFIEAALLEFQTTDVFKLAEDGKHLVSINGVDSTASASIKVDEFIKYADEAIAKANGELPATADVDSMSSASLTTDGETLKAALSADGNWIAAAIGDTVVEGELVVDGEFHSKNDPNAAVYRKLTPSNHVNGADGTRDKSKEEFYVLTATDGMVVNSPNLNLVNGTFVGDITVNATGFTTSNMTIIGDVVFTNQEARDTATFNNTNITGDVTPEMNTTLKDGTYVGTTPITADTKYQDQVTVVVKWGKVTSVNYDPKVVTDGVATKVGKKELSSKGEYNMVSTTGVGTWAEQAKALEKFAMAGNTAPGVDGVTGATIKNEGFFAAYNDALNQATK